MLHDFLSWLKSPDCAASRCSPATRPPAWSARSPRRSRRPDISAARCISTATSLPRSPNPSVPRSLPQVQHDLLLGQQVIATRHPGQAGETRRHHDAVMPTVDTLLKLGAERRTLRTQTNKGYPFCQDENARGNGRTRENRAH